MFFIIALAALIFVSFAISASAGMGGSLVLIPGLLIFFEPATGIALAAVLLAANNVAKVIAYRKTIPLRKAAIVILATVAGAAFGAKLLIGASKEVVHTAVVISLLGSLFAERLQWEKLRTGSAPLLALFSGVSSGFSGTSGPLKGSALRNLQLDRLHLVGAASVVSLVGDATKASVFLGASILSEDLLWMVAIALPMIPAATLLGRKLNNEMSERAYSYLFWTVMGGYALRLSFS